ncbi:MAG: MerR family transcriptional regulator [Cytophagales bacterium]|nr:MAG: MerR family transcriptional regulator [Cytophagales bacterium]
MSNYSIKDLEVLSGIKAHTLRIWEQRYNLIAPLRSDTNIRQYNGEDLKLLLNVSLLNDNGYKISKIASMTHDQVIEEVISLTEKNSKFSDQIHALTLSMIDIDEPRFEKIISKNILQLGLEKTMINIIYPFFTKIGLMWQTGSINPAQEHFISNLVRQKLIVAIDGQYNILTEKAKKFLLFLSEGELHELSLLFTHYIVKSRMQKSIYLGQSLPFQDLHKIYISHKPEYIVTSITSTPKECSVQDYVLMLGNSFPNSTILLSGYQVVGQDLKITSNTIILNKIDDLIDLIEDIK